MTYVDPQLIDKAASNVVSAPLAYMELAQQYLEQACDADPLAFGIVGLPVLTNQYEQTRCIHIDNIKAGCDKLEEIASGLSYVAAFWSQAEAANTPTGTKPDLEYVAPTGGSNINSGLEFTSLYFSWSLMAVILAAEEIMVTCGRLAPAAMTAGTLWALWTPDDARLGEMQGGWSMAADKVAAVTNELNAALKPLDEGWLGTDDRTAFDNWLPGFQTELDQTVRDLRAVCDRLGELQSDLDGMQQKLFVFAQLTLIMIITYDIIGTIPGMNAIATVAKNIQGALLGFSTAKALGDAASILGVSLLFSPSILTADMPSLSINANNMGTGLEDITIDWDDSAATHYAD